MAKKKKTRRRRSPLQKFDDIVLGIDVGVTGCIAVRHPDGVSHELIDVESYEGRERRKFIDCHALDNAMFDLGTQNPKRRFVAYVEQLTATPRSTVTSFSQGHSLGVIEYMCAAYGIVLVRMTAREWQTYHFGHRRIDNAVRKRLSLARARELHPEHREDLTRQRDHDRAEALLIADAGVALHPEHLHYV